MTSRYRHSPSLLKTVISIGILTAVPFLYYAKIPRSGLRAIFQDIVVAWDGLLHTSIWPIAVTTSAFALFFARRKDVGCCNHRRKNSQKVDKKWCNVVTCTLCLSAFFTLITMITCQLQIIYPSWVWNPFLWGNYQVFNPSHIEGALQGMCLDYTDDQTDPRRPLCLKESSWKTLSSGKLSSRRSDDVRKVMKGASYATDVSGGIIINVMSRDTADSIGTLRENVEGLTPFFKELSVVVFENDSSDGTREAFKDWAAEAEGYKVDLMECEDAVDCKFGVSHRYDAKEAKDYFKSSAIGRMAEFRQRMVDYIVASPLYEDYSHMIVLDMDLGVSLSPLGVLHTLGELPDNPVASTGRQVWPGSFGTLTPPYDFSAFRAIETPQNKNLFKMHEKFCGLLGEGDRWKNQCDATSPMQMTMVLSQDRSVNEFDKVASAFNGATMYPLKLVRESGAKYDVGVDGQRCEHIGFNLSMNKSMYMNSKWGMNLSPINPGGPTGLRALKSVLRVSLTPRLVTPLVIQSSVCIILFVFCVMTLVMNLGYPLICKAIVRSKGFKEISLPIVVDRGNLKTKSKSADFDYLLGNPKRKFSDFD